MTQPDISLDQVAVRTRPGRLARLERRGPRVALRTEGAWIELVAVADGIAQITWHPGDAWKNEPTRYAERPESASRLHWRQVAPNRLMLGELSVRFDSDPIRLAFGDRRGTFLEEEGGESFGYLSRGVAVAWRVSRNEGIYGLGQQAFAGLDRVGQYRRMAANHQGHVGGDIPVAFFASTRGYGVLIDNPNVGAFDLRSKGRLAFEAEDGYIRYFVIHGPSLADVVGRYVRLTGKPPLPPRWFFGPLFSRIPGGGTAGYRSSRELLALARKTRNRGIPVDGLFLDYQWDEWIGAFRWDQKRFGDPQGWLAELKRMGIATILQLKPAVNLPASTTADLRRDGLLLARRDGTVHTSNFHRGVAAFLDFFNPRSRTWYGRQLKGLLADGVAGWWTDEGDWLGFEERCARDLDRSAGGMRNLYNNAWCATIHDAHRRASRKRVVNLTRTGSAGLQRWGASVWSGDVSATWEGLTAQLQMGLNAAFSGIPFWTTDGGGFLGTPSPELYVRWAQFAAFSPITRFHGVSPREPWHFGRQAERIVRDILCWRIRLMPYVYATAWRAHVDGIPMMRAMAMVDSADPRFRNLSSQYMFGDALLVRPITEPRRKLQHHGAKVRTELPAGVWYDFWTGRRMDVRHDGQERRRNHAIVGADLETIPVYVRGPAIVVLAEPAQSAGGQSWDSLTCRIYAGEMNTPWNSAFVLYEDDGETYAYERGKSFVTKLVARRRDARCVGVSSTPQGARVPFVPARRRWRVELYGVAARPEVRTRATTMPARRDGAAWVVELPAAPTSNRIAVTFRW